VAAQCAAASSLIVDGHVAVHRRRRQMDARNGSDVERIAAAAAAVARLEDRLATASRRYSDQSRTST
jgi:hypothetical protein